MANTVALETGRRKQRPYTSQAIGPPPKWRRSTRLRTAGGRLQSQPRDRTQRAGGAADRDLDRAGGHAPGMRVRIPAREGPVVEREGDGLLLARRQRHLAEVAQLARRPRAVRRKADVELHRLFTGAVAAVLHRDGTGYGLAGAPAAAIQRHGAVGEGGVGEAVPETEARLEAVRVEVAVAHAEVFAVRNATVLVAERHRLLQRTREGHGQAAGGVLPPEEEIGDRVADLLPTEPGQEAGRALVDPGRLERGAGREDDGSARVGGADAAHQLVLAAGQAHVRAIAALRFPLAGGADDDDCGGGPRRRRNRTLQHVGRLRGGAAEREPGRRRRLTDGAQLDAQIVGAARLERDVRDDLRRAAPEEALARALRRRRIEHDRAVETDDRVPRAHQPQTMG